MESKINRRDSILWIASALPRNDADNIPTKPQKPIKQAKTTKLQFFQLFRAN
ncbi:hypothetical protein [Helicobacter sp.]|uniref:hypothetical protein n=1 Tax=Helicobacter sp. TaxID=218 RepID=UPI0019C0CC41|nr:hypothetical protein [Helicobacter sp.]MBD5165798.1 hypothetical protein [Helicobacter sp.]